MGIVLGCIADDFTGATDLAGTLVKAGLPTVQTIGVPTAPLPDGTRAVVVALKSRTAPVDEAVRDSLGALAWLQDQGADQIYFKYCSTFDSTPSGNIGPVADALMDALGTDLAIVCPAFPANARTIYKGNLFVGDVPLSESGMRHHPLTPMTDSNLVRVIAAQTRRSVGLVEHGTVRQGSEAVRARFEALRREGVGYAVTDALADDDLVILGEACRTMRLVTAGSGLGLGLARIHANGSGAADTLPATGGRRAILSGSCSEATNRQVAHFLESGVGFRIDPVRLAEGRDLARDALDWAFAQPPDAPVLVYATAPPDAVRAVQDRLGVGEAGRLVEETLSRVAAGLAEKGFGRFVVAGGETSGAVVGALGVEALVIGPEIDPGVPWTATIGGGRTLALALKSGNFGTDDFFVKAWTRLP